MQSYANHTRWVPMYHFVAGPLLIVNFLYAAWNLTSGVTIGSVLFLTTSFALLLTLFYARFFALKVQDRLIRLEMRLRLKELMADPHNQIHRLSVSQMVGLRFASDAELPALVEAALRDNLKSGDIKKMIKDWRADTDRA